MVRSSESMVAASCLRSGDIPRPAFAHKEGEKGGLVGFTIT